MNPRDAINFLRWHLSDPRYAPTRLALDCGLSRGALSGLFSDDPLRFNPRLSTLIRLFDEVPEERKREWLGLLPTDPSAIERHTISVRRYATDRGILYERTFDIAGIGDLEPLQLAPMWRYIENQRVDTIIRRGAVRRDIVKSLAPDAAIHIVNTASDNPFEFTALVWDAETGYEGGRDFTGLSVRDILDDAYAQAVAERYQQSARTGTGLLSFVHRKGPDGIRTFFRVLIPLLGDGDQPLLLTVSLPQRSGSELQMFPEADLWRWRDGRSSRSRIVDRDTAASREPGTRRREIA